MHNFLIHILNQRKLRESHHWNKQAPFLRRKEVADLEVERLFGGSGDIAEGFNVNSLAVWSTPANSLEEWKQLAEFQLQD